MTIKVAVVQDAPVFFDKEATLKKVETITTQYASGGCELIVFPESFIPGYPRGFSFGATIGSRSDEGRQHYADYYNNSFDLESDDLPRLETLSKEQNIYIVIGVTERQEKNGSLYCSMLYLSPTKGLLGVHRKIKPTGTERLVWAEAGAESLVTFDTKIGKLGGLICWEHLMPLARNAMYENGVQILAAPTWDKSPNWLLSMQSNAREGGVFIISCCMALKMDDIPDEYDFKKLYPEGREWINSGNSCIVAPNGKIIAGPMEAENGLLYAEINLNDIIASKRMFDVVGHYARPDVFEFKVKSNFD